MQPRRAIVGVMLAAALVLGSAFAAGAHDPLILTADDPTPAEGPRLPDGTISFALYGVIDPAGATRGFRVAFRDGDPVELSVLVPDLEPERDLDDDELPQVTVTRPDGTVVQMAVGDRVMFDEPFTGTRYLRYSALTEPAIAGEYAVLVSGTRAARFSVAVGNREQFGTRVENVDNRDAGLTGVMAWYQTPPEDPADPGSGVVSDTAETAGPATPQPTERPTSEPPAASAADDEAAAPASARADEPAANGDNRWLTGAVLLAVVAGGAGVALMVGRSRR